jgi:hypothetical protein
MEKYPYDCNYFTFGGFIMKKSSLFISTILSVFVLAVLTGAVSAYRAFTVSTVQSQQTVPVAQAVQDQISPEQAAQLAAQYWGRNDLYSVESTLVKGMDAYKVTFSSGDVVYISPDGQVLGVFAAPRVAPQNNGLSFQSAQSGFQSSDDNNGHEDHDDD